MDVNKHLSDEQFAELLATRSASLPLHIDRCPACYDKYRLAERMIRGVAAHVRERAADDEYFWTRQRAKILQRAAVRRTPFTGRLAWAGLAAVVVIAMALLTGGPSPLPASPALQEAFDPDHDLLMRVEYATDNPGPRALEPAALLAVEINDGIQKNSRNTNPSTEKANEN